MSTITTEEAFEILYDSPVANQEWSSHRWYTKRLIVYEASGALWGFYYDEPATEMQEGQDVFEADPVPTFPVTSREVKLTVYEPAPE